MTITSVLVDFADDGSLRLHSRTVYENKPPNGKPSPKKHRAQTAEILRAALRAVEAGELDDLGQKEQSQRRTLVKTWQARES